MRSHQLLHKLKLLGLSVDYGRVLCSLAQRGKTIKEICAENPGMTGAVVHAMAGCWLKHQRISRAYVFRLTERGMNDYKAIFDEETAAPTRTEHDSPPLPFP